jgi:hypothetical protein
MVSSVRRGALEQPSFQVLVFSTVENMSGGETTPPVAQAYKGAGNRRQTLKVQATRFARAAS